MAGLAVIKARATTLATVRRVGGLAKVVVGENAAEAARQAQLAILAANDAADAVASIGSSVDDAQDAATAAQAAQTAAESARDATLAAYDSFDDRYLGAKASNPATDNDGNALVAGALYYNTTVPEMRLYTGSSWVAAYVSGGSFLGLSGGTLTGGLILVASASGTVPLRIPQGTDPSSPTNGDIWMKSGGLFFRYNSVTGQVSGTNTGDQTITLTGDVTGTGTGSFAATIANSAVGLAKMANVASGTVFYRKTASSGAPEVQTLATLKSDLGLTGTNTGDQSVIGQGVHTIPLLAASLLPRTTSGCAAAVQVETTTNKVNLRVLDFDPSSTEYAQIALPMPKGWDEGTIQVQFGWLVAGGTGNVVWGARARAFSDDDALDAAMGTAQTVTDGVTATGDLMWSAYTSAITIAGTPAAEDMVLLEVYRDAASGSDTLNSNDARLALLRIKYTVNAETDA